MTLDQKVRDSIPSINHLCSYHSGDSYSHIQAHADCSYCRPSRLFGETLTESPSQSTEWCRLVNLKLYFEARISVLVFNFEKLSGVVDSLISTQFLFARPALFGQSVTR